MKWIKQASQDGKFKTSKPVMSVQQFLALIEAFALWPQLYSYNGTLPKKEQQEVLDSAVEMLLNNYAVS